MNILEKSVLLRLRANLETFMLHRNLCTIHMFLSTQKLFNIFNKGVVYPNGSLIQNSSSFVGFRMWNRFLLIPFASLLFKWIYLPYESKSGLILDLNLKQRQKGSKTFSYVIHVLTKRYSSNLNQILRENL